MAQGTTAADMQRLFGRAVLFIGVQAQHWTVSTFIGAAKLARQLGIDTISPKRADGSIRWYDTSAHLRDERQAVLDQGVGYAPFLYAYGPKFGDQQIHDEVGVLEEMAEANAGSVIVDMETEWNGQVAAASLFEQLMRPVPCILGITTWADPVDQDWLGVAAALAPAANLWIPQRYDNWLAAQPVPTEETIVQPGIDLSSEFGANNILAIVERTAQLGQSAWLWEYTYAESQQAFVRVLCDVLHGRGRTELPGLITEGELATPDMGFNHAYVVADSDTSLAQIAANLGLSNWYQELYKVNTEALDSAARAAGHPAGSSGGMVIVPGTKLNYNL